MTHCPHSPDLAPNDFFLFPLMKNKMRGQRFNNLEEATEAYKYHVSACHFLSGTNVLKIGLFECKNVSMLQENTLKRNKSETFGKKLFFVLLSKNLSTAPRTLMHL